MICPDCERGKVRLQLTNIKVAEESLFPRSLSGFQTVLCPNCNGSGNIEYCDGKGRRSSSSLDAGKPIYLNTV